MGQVGQTSLAVVPTMKGFRSKVNAEVKASAKMAGRSMSDEFGRAGARSGKLFGRGYTSQAKLLERAVKDTTRANAQATSAWSTANRRNADALGQVRVAQAKLNDSVKRYGANSTQAITAQERLAMAQRRAEETGVRLVAAQQRLAASKAAMQKATDAATRAQDRSSSSMGRLRSAAGNVAGFLRQRLGPGLATVWNGVVRGAQIAGEAIGKAFKAGAVVAGVALAGIATQMVAGGWNRLTGIENAQAKMRGLGFAAEDIQAAMDGASEAVDGTAYSLDEMASAASTAMAAGLKPGKQLNAYMRTLKNAAAAANVPLGEMGPILNKVQTAGRAYTQEINQIADRGLPIWSKLAEAYGVTAEEMRKMVSDGEVDAATFMRVMDEMTGSVADAMGDTTTSKIRNFRTALSKLGADMLQGLYPVIGPLFDGMKSGVQMIQAVLAPAFLKLGDETTGLQERLQRFTNKWAEIREEIAAGGDPLELISKEWPKFGRMLEGLRDAVLKLPAAIGLLTDGWKAFSDEIGPVVKEVGPVLIDTFKEVLEVLKPIIPMLSEELLDAFVELAPSVADLAVALAPLIPPLVDLLEVLVPIATDILEWLVPAMVEMTDTGVAPLAEAMENLIGFFSGDIGAESFIEQMEEMDNWLIDFSLTVGQFVVDTVENFNRLKTSIEIALQLIGGAFERARIAILLVLESIRQKFDEKWNEIITGVVGFVAKIRAKVDEVKGVISGIRTRVESALSGIGSWLVDSGRALIQGFIDGINDMVGAAGNAVAGVVDWVRGFFPSSPAKRGPLSGPGWGKLRDSGRAYMDQWTLGVEDGAASFDLDNVLQHVDAAPSWSEMSETAAVRAGAKTVYVEAKTDVHMMERDPERVGRAIGRGVEVSLGDA